MSSQRKNQIENSIVRQAAAPVQRNMLKGISLFADRPPVLADKRSHQMKNDSFPRVNNQQDYSQPIIPSLPTDDNHHPAAARLNQTTAYQEVPWVPKTSQNHHQQSHFLSQTPDLYDNDRMTPLNRTVASFAPHMTTHTNLAPIAMHQSINIEKNVGDMLMSVKSYTPIVNKQKQAMQFQAHRLPMKATVDSPVQRAQQVMSRELLCSPFMSKKASLDQSDSQYEQQHIRFEGEARQRPAAASGNITIAGRARRRKRNLTDGDQVQVEVVKQQQYQYSMADLSQTPTQGKLKISQKVNSKSRKGSGKSKEELNQKLMRALDVNKDDYLKMINDLSRKQASFMARTSGAVHKDPLMNFIRPGEARIQQVFSPRQTNYVSNEQASSTASASYSTVKRRRKKGVSANAKNEGSNQIKTFASQSFY